MAFSDPSHYVPLAVASEEAGLWGLAVSDHVLQPKVINSPYPYTKDNAPRFTPFTPWVDPWVSIGAMSAVTERIRFFTNVYVLGLRNVFITAKQVSTASVFSNGRVSLGIGLGWMEEEFDLTERPFAKRGRRIDEMVDILRGVWGADGEWFSYHGEFHEIPEMEMSPRPPEPIPVYVGGISDFALRRAARIGDGWISDLQPRAELARQIAQINAYREEYHRADIPFEFICSCSDVRGVDGYRQLEADGVTCLLTMPWVYTHGFTEDLSARIEGTQAFGENVIAQM
jgi:probable F420-dependent oxidoreductase